MKKALLLTDGSVDTALSLNRWLEAQSEPVDLTIVYGFALNPAAGRPLKAVAFREARQAAQAEINQWLHYLSPMKTGQLRTELLLGEPELVLTIHLLLRRYDYLLVDAEQKTILSTFRACQQHVTTEAYALNPSEEPVISSRPLWDESLESLVYADRQLAA